MSIEEVLNELPAPEMDQAEPATEPSVEPEPQGAETAQKAEPVSPSVPLEALREERERRREVQAQLQVLEARMAQILEAMQNQKPAERQEETEEPISYEEDPMGYIKQQLDILTKQINGTAKETAEEKQIARFNELRNSVAAAEQAFASQTPDYWDSVSFLQKRRADELQALGYSDQQIAVTLGQDAANLVNLALQRNANPAQFAYDLAKKLGFKGKQLDVLKGQGAASEPPSSLSGMGGSAVNEGMPSVQDISKMSDTEFNRLFKKYFPG